MPGDASLRHKTRRYEGRKSYGKTVFNVRLLRLSSPYITLSHYNVVTSLREGKENGEKMQNRLADGPTDRTVATNKTDLIKRKK